MNERKYSMIHLDCNILWWHNSKTDKDNPNLKKSLIGNGLSSHNEGYPGLFKKILSPKYEINQRSCVTKETILSLCQKNFSKDCLNSLIVFSFWCQISLKYKVYWCSLW